MYDLPPDILSTLARKDDTNTGPQDDGISEQAKTEPAESRAEEAVGSKACSLCGVTFHTVEDQRSHVRSDLHGYNLKQRIRGGKSATEAEFEKLIEGLKPFSSFKTTTDIRQILKRVFQALTHQILKTRRMAKEGKRPH